MGHEVAITVQWALVGASVAQGFSKMILSLRFQHERRGSMDLLLDLAIVLREAEDPAIFDKARAAAVVVFTKDEDFVDLAERLGTPPQILWPVGTWPTRVSGPSFPARFQMRSNSCGKARRSWRSACQKASLAEPVAPPDRGHEVARASGGRPVLAAAAERQAVRLAL